MFKWLKKKMDKWAEKESRELDNFVYGKMREQIKKDCPMLFEGFRFK